MSEKKIKRGQGYYSISAVSKMFSIHQQTVRLYEKEGFISPKRSAGNTRMFTEQDIDRLEEVIYLTHQLGINLAGVEMILQLQQKIKKMQQDMNKIFVETQKDLTAQTHARKVLVQNYSVQLQQKKQQEHVVDVQQATQAEENSTFKDWDLDYED